MNIEMNKITDDRLISALVAARSIGGAICTLWSFPEPETSVRARQRLLMHFAGFSLGRMTLTPVTIYGVKDPGGPVETAPVAYCMTDRFIERLVSLRKKVERCCDSVAVYHERNHELLMFAVFHENMIGTKEGLPNQAL
jgi:hypothetical protein